MDLQFYDLRFTILAAMESPDKRRSILLPTLENHAARGLTEGWGYEDDGISGIILEGWSVR